VEASEGKDGDAFRTLSTERQAPDQSGLNPLPQLAQRTLHRMAI
jgi:hypothetical protein